MPLKEGQLKNDWEKKKWKKNLERKITEERKEKKNDKVEKKIKDQRSMIKWKDIFKKWVLKRDCRKTAI